MFYCKFHANFRIQWIGITPEELFLEHEGDELSCAVRMVDFVTLVLGESFIGAYWIKKGILRKIICGWGIWLCAWDLGP